MDNYLGLNNKDGRRVLVWPVPYEGTVSLGTGTRDGPAAILKTSLEIETWNEALGLDLADWAHFETWPQLCPPVSGPEAVFQAQLRHLEHAPGFDPAQDLLLTLGGEHGVALAPIQVYSKAHPNLVVLQIDAHADLRPSYQGSAYSHACVMARVRELGLPLIQIGIRSLSRAESRLIHSSPTSEQLALFACSLPDPITAARRCREFLGQRPVYISFDADGLDPGVLPGTGTPEPGGLSLAWLDSFWSYFWPGVRLLGLDFCELAPIPGSRVSEAVAVQAINSVLINALSRADSKP